MFIIVFWFWGYQKMWYDFFLLGMIFIPLAPTVWAVRGCFWVIHHLWMLAYMHLDGGILWACHQLLVVYCYTFSTHHIPQATFGSCFVQCCICIWCFLYGWFVVCNCLCVQVLVEAVFRKMSWTWCIWANASTCLKLLLTGSRFVLCVCY